MSEEVSRGEFDLLKSMVKDLGDRLTSIDEHGTRGVAVIQAQLTELIKDLVEMKTELANEKTARLTGRRWLIGVGIAGIAACGGLITAVIAVLQHVHG